MRIRTGVILAAAMAATTMTGVAQGTGADVYKSKCAMCHGADGMASNPAGKAKKVPPVTGPEFKAPEADLIAATKNGKGKMKPSKGKLTDAQIKDSVDYLLTLKK